MGRSVKAEQKEGLLQTELSKREVLRLNNQKSNELTREWIANGYDLSPEELANVLELGVSF